MNYLVLCRLARAQSTSAVPNFTPGNIEVQSRRALYGALPFVAAFGMQHRENKIRRVLSTMSTTTLESLAMQESEVRQVVLCCYSQDRMIEYSYIYCIKLIINIIEAQALLVFRGNANFVFV